MTRSQVRRMAEKQQEGGPGKPPKQGLPGFSVTRCARPVAQLAHMAHLLSASAWGNLDPPLHNCAREQCDTATRVITDLSTRANEGITRFIPGPR